MTTENPVVVFPPIETSVAPIKSVPLIVTAVPPLTDPYAGVTPVTVGPATYVYAFDLAVSYTHLTLPTNREV